MCATACFRALPFLMCRSAFAAACAVFALAGIAPAAAAPVTTYRVTGTVTATDAPRATTFAVRVTTASRNARGLIRTVVVIRPGAKTRFVDARGRRLPRRTVAVGNRVRVIWRALQGRPAREVAVDAPRVVVRLSRR
jgi:hypothetical protein